MEDEEPALQGSDGKTLPPPEFPGVAAHGPSETDLAFAALRREREREERRKALGPLPANLAQVRIQVDHMRHTLVHMIDGYGDQLQAQLQAAVEAEVKAFDFGKVVRDLVGRELVSRTHTAIASAVSDLFSDYDQEDGFRPSVVEALTEALRKAAIQNGKARAAKKRKAAPRRVK